MTAVPQTRTEVLQIPNGKVEAWIDQNGKWTGFKVRGCGPVMTRNTKAELVKAIAEWEPTEW